MRRRVLQHGVRRRLTGHAPRPARRPPRGRPAGGGPKPAACAMPCACSRGRGAPRAPCRRQPGETREQAEGADDERDDRQRVAVASPSSSSDAAAGLAARRPCPRRARPRPAAGAATSLTCGAGCSLSGVPIQRTTSPPEYVWIALNVSVLPALSGTATEIPKSWNSPGRMPAPSVLNVMVSTRSVRFSPKTSTGLSSLAILTFTSQPGTGWCETEMKPAGNWTSTFLVDASSRSLGTRTSRRLNPPAGTSLGCSVTCAGATAGRPAAATAVSTAIRR